MDIANSIVKCQQLSSDELANHEIMMPLRDMIAGYFNYDFETNTFLIAPKIEKIFKNLFNREADNKTSKLFENESLINILDNFIVSDECQLTKEIVVKHKSEPWETFLLKCQKSTQGETLKLFGIFIDVTHKQRQDMMESQLDKLQALGQLTSGVSHDFNNQLNGILGYVVLAKTLTQDEGLLRYMEGIERAVEHSTELTKQLLSFSHQTDNKKVNLNLTEVVEDVSSMLEHTINRQIEIKKNIQNASCYVMGDTSQLHNAMLNLCLNARDAISGNGEITLEVNKEYVESIEDNLISTHIEAGVYAVVRIKDTGSGIKPELIHKIFKPFFTTKGVGKGTGMGLAAVATAIRGHNGAITIHSEVGRGTTFTLYIPSLTEDHEHCELQKICRGSGQILLIDDEYCNLEITHTLLESFGYSVTSFSNPEEAIEYYAKNAEIFDCILLDVIMPKMSGTEVFEALKIINPSNKIILLTGISELSEIEFILRHGVDDYVKKPVNQYELSSVVYNVLKMNEYEPPLVTLDQLNTLESSLNLEAALAGIGNNVRLYLKVTHKFRKQFYMIGDQLSQLIATNSELAFRRVHTIKGLAAQIGADELYVYCKELEQALTNNLETDALVSIFKEEFMEVMDELARFETLKMKL